MLPCVPGLGTQGTVEVHHSTPGELGWRIHSGKSLMGLETELRLKGNDLNFHQVQTLDKHSSNHGLWTS